MRYRRSRMNSDCFEPGTNPKLAGVLALRYVEHSHSGHSRGAFPRRGLNRINRWSFTNWRRCWKIDSGVILRSDVCQLGRMIIAAIDSMPTFYGRHDESTTVARKPGAPQTNGKTTKLRIRCAKFTMSSRTALYRIDWSNEFFSQKTSRATVVADFVPIAASPEQNHFCTRGEPSNRGCRIVRLVANHR